MNIGTKKITNKLLTLLNISSIIKIGNDNSTNVVLPIRFEKLTPNSSKNRCEFSFYLCSCLSTQFLYRTVAKATFNVKDNIRDIIKNSITSTINITTLPTKIRKNWWQNHICLSSFPMVVSITYNI